MDAKPKKPGRPSHNPTARDRQFVEVLAGFGFPPEKIASMLGIGRSTLYRHYPNEVQTGAAKLEAQLAGNLLRIAQGSDGTALKAIIFSLTTRFGWSQFAPLGRKAQAQLDAEAGPDPDSDWYDLIN